MRLLRFIEAFVHEYTKAITPKNFIHYGDWGTIHHTEYLHVETHRGKVVSVWFRCLQLPFEQVRVDKERSGEMDRANEDVKKRIRIQAVDVLMDES